MPVAHAEIIDTAGLHVYRARLLLVQGNSEWRMAVALALLCQARARVEALPLAICGKGGRSGRSLSIWWRMACAAAVDGAMLSGGPWGDRARLGPIGHVRSRSRGLSACGMVVVRAIGNALPTSSHIGGRVGYAVVGNDGLQHCSGCPNFRGAVLAGRVVGRLGVSLNMWRTCGLCI